MKTNTNKNNKDKNNGLKFDDLSRFLKEFLESALAGYIVIIFICVFIISSLVYLFLDTKNIIGIITNKDLVEDIEKKIELFSSDPIKGRWFSLQIAIDDFNDFLKEEISSKNLEVANAALLSDNELTLKRLSALYNKIKEEKKKERSRFDGRQIDKEDIVREMQKDLTLAPFTMPFPQKPYSNSQEDLGYALKRLQNQRSEALRIIIKAIDLFKELEELEKTHKDTIESFEDTTESFDDATESF